MHLRHYHVPQFARMGLFFDRRGEHRHGLVIVLAPVRATKRDAVRLGCRALCKLYQGGFGRIVEHTCGRKPQPETVNASQLPAGKPTRLQSPIEGAPSSVGTVLLTILPRS
jgi:hypothetical protein